MKKIHYRISWTFICCLMLAYIPQSHSKSINEFTEGMKPFQGFFEYYWDEAQGKIWLRINDFDQDFLYINSLQSGVGSNDIGLDRGQLGDKRLVKFTKIGPKVLLIQPNLKYRAISDNPHERRAVAEAFAQSILWGFKIIASEKDSVLVDATDFLLRDSHGISQRLSELEQGSYSIDESRSAIYLPQTKSFPDNSEFEALITLTGSKPGEYIRSVAPTAEIVSVRTHHSFVRLPDNNYQPRAFDPRSGAIAISYTDYAAPLGESMEKKWAIRHRLQKKYPQHEVSDPVKPIIYYLDPGTPEPVKSALIDGAKWWEKGFEAAGFSNAFQIKLLPADADPLDVRYNTIQWVHRSTRGWSYGDSVVDPRTGEIIKGHVTLGSLRVRQDMLIAQGLLSPFKKGDEIAEEIQKMALARLRQLSAHEVGHTLGIIHNFFASTQNRASVMDYPHPLVKINASGELDLSDAYSVGVGEWDLYALSYLYREFPDKSKEKNALNAILADAHQKGLDFISDNDARALGGSHPAAHLWDNGPDPVKSLEDILKIRKKALANFGINTIPAGTDLFYLEQIYVPIFLFHRYQTEAVVKLIGGVDYHYAMRDDPDTENRLVSADQQRQALSVLMQSIQAEQLATPESILRVLLPPIDDSHRHSEHFKTRTSPNFDPLAAAEAATRHTIGLLLRPERAARLIEHDARQTTGLNLSTIIDSLIASTWNKTHVNDTYLNEVQRSINWVSLSELMKLASNPQASPQVSAIVIYKLKQLKSWLEKNKPGSEIDKAFTAYAVDTIKHFMQSGQPLFQTEVFSMPPGSPIGN